MDDILEPWARIDVWLSQHAPSIRDELRGPADRKDVEALERTIGFALPDELAASYAVHDGGGSGLFGGARFLSLAEVRQRWLELRDVGFGLDGVPNRGEPDGPVQPVWWHPRWLPVLDRAGGDCVCVDCAPADGGVVGQLVEVFNYDARRPVVARSVSAWLGTLAADLAGGRYFDDDGWLTRSEEPDPSPPAPARGAADDGSSPRESRAVAVARAREIAQWLASDGAIALRDEPTTALCEAIATVVAGAGNRNVLMAELWTLLMEHDDVEDVFVSQLQLERTLRAMATEPR